MPMLIKTTDEYLYEKKRDILILEMRVREDPEYPYIDRDLCEQEAQPQLKWFKDRGFDSYYTCGPELLCGWLGHYYIDVDPDHNVLSEYVSEWETPEGRSLKPEVYQMLQYSYDSWVQDGGIGRHERHLKNMADPDYCP